eukprot:2554893-Amphidinium_carterae.1
MSGATNTRDKCESKQILPGAGYTTCSTSIYHTQNSRGWSLFSKGVKPEHEAKVYEHGKDTNFSLNGTIMHRPSSETVTKKLYRTASRMALSVVFQTCWIVIVSMFSAESGGE